MYILTAKKDVGNDVLTMRMLRAI